MRENVSYSPSIFGVTVAISECQYVKASSVLCAVFFPLSPKLHKKDEHYLYCVIKVHLKGSANWYFYI